MKLDWNWTEETNGNLTFILCVFYLFMMYFTNSTNFGCFYSALVVAGIYLGMGLILALLLNRAGKKENIWRITVGWLLCMPNSKLRKWVLIESHLRSLENFIVELETKAEENDPEAINNLALMHLDGNELVAPNHRKAISLFSKAKDLGHPSSMVCLGVCYFQGLYGVSVDNMEAAKLFHKAAELHYVPGMINLSICYAMGKGVVKDDDQAFSWWMNAVALTREDDKNMNTLLANAEKILHVYQNEPENPSLDK
jgi:TPR repeat protein